VIERKIALAILLIKRSSPLPLTLTTELLAAGIDVAALENKYA
jgi:hypothetical protein